MEFQNELAKLGIDLTEKQSKQFEKYYQKLIEVNQVMNLTAITEKEAVYRKHFLDSLEITRALKNQKNYTLCDVGSGAGFPSIPLAIVKSDVQVTIIDALNKRVSFLQNLLKELGLDNVYAFHKRAEEFVKEKREAFDVVTARAVAKLNILAELCLPLTKVGGVFIALKGSAGTEEFLEATNAIHLLGGKLLEVIDFVLPDEEEQRQILVFQKVKKTPPRYPRNFNKMKEKPLS
ncbi:MAG: 16S rRNA (guanine(527)-N(7))-methyltransferase RsmG [Anaeroplasmataceae bacterium]|nr:16S rRNA (guanine(527)-N(7))-methyltransferase RsmG [Anaeroplasmataceae bacterium]